MTKTTHMLKKWYKNFKLKNLSSYHNQNDTLLLADVFENFRNKCIETYELDPAHFLSAPGSTDKLVLKRQK